MSSVAKKPLGKRCECPQCGFKWSRPAGENGKPCPKCQTPFNDSQMVRSAPSAVAKKPAIPRANAAPVAPRSPVPAPVSPQPEVKATVAAQRSPSPKRAAAGSTSPKKDIFSRLTDVNGYTGAHKARFNADGSGRGLAGRDSINKGFGTAAGSQTGGVHSGIGAKKASVRTTGKLTCPTCGYSWNRPAGEAGRPCPKCQTPV